MAQIEKLLEQTEWTKFEIRTLNRHHYHPQNKKMCTDCYSVLDKTTEKFDIFRKNPNGTYLLTGRCKPCNSIFRADKKKRMRADPEWYCRNLVASLRCRAREEQIPFDLTGEQLYNKLVAQDFKCYYTGLPIDLTATSENHTNAHRNMGSVDKMTPIDGYVHDNVVWTTFYVNRMKSNLTYEEFVSMSKLVVELHT